ncbi:MAG: thioredoxin family protein [Usitatibacter sp.]
MNTPKHYLFRVAALCVLGLLPNAAMAAGPVYPDVASARADVDAALAQAAKGGKRVLVDFGGNWCGDCKVLDANLRRAENAALLDKHYVLVHVNVGDKGIDNNFDIAERYGIPLKKGVPALAVLENDGRLVYSQKNGEFESMRTLDPKSVQEFLDRWRGPRT